MSEDNKETNQTENNSNIDKVAQDWVEKFLVSILKPTTKYTPAIGSGYLFFSFLHQQEWIMVLISFPVTVLAVIWAKYSEGVLIRFGEIYSERGKQDVDSFVAWIDKTDQVIKESVKWQFSGVEDKYLRCLKSTDDSLFYLTEGLEQKETNLLLADVFIELRITSTNLNIPVGFNYKDKDLHEILERDIWSFLKDAQRNPSFHSLMITAKGGLGKTTLLKHITHIYANHKYKSFDAPKLIPVLLYLRRWQDKLSSENAPNLPTLIEQDYLLDLPLGDELKLPANWAKNHLKNGKMLIMLDGFDEVKKDLRQGVSEWIANQLKHYPYNYFIITSRPYAASDYQGKVKPKTRLSVIPFNDAQKARFIQRWYECRVKINHQRHDLTEKEMIAKATQKAKNLIKQIKERDELKQLTRNPLMLNMLINLHSLSQSRKLPNKRSDLYEQVITLQLGSRPLAKDIELVLGAKQSEEILQGIALEMMKEEKRQFTKEDLMAKTKQQCIRYSIHSSVSENEFLREIETISELIVKIDDDYEFAHLSFQEYLASKEINKTQQESLLIDNWDKSWWRETILLYSAQFIPTRLLQHLIEVKSDEAIKLAKLCINEIPQKKYEKVKQSLNLNDLDNIENIANQVNESLFEKLEEYLKNEQWREADEETTRLMVELGDKDEKGYLDIDDCQNFPKEELRTIDQLWLKYSEGKFGFSVQKEIYLEVGGKLDNCNWDSYEKMSDRIGWRKNQAWYNYEDYTFDKTKAIRGHLPGRGVGTLRNVGRKNEIMSLFSSLDSNI